MKKPVKRVLIVIGLIILVGLAGILITVRSVAKTMTPVETIKVVDNIYAIKDSYVNMFIVKDSNQYIAIDCGNNRDVLSRELMKLNIESDKIVAILLTHTDLDHVAAVKLFKNAALYFSSLEEQMINGSKHRFPLSHNNIGNKEYSLIEDQQILNIGNVKIKGISSPGHTTGSMCYLINDKYLFTGDALRLKDGKVHEFIKFINMDSKTALTSIHKITQIPEAEFIFTSHHGFTNDFRHAVKDW